MYLKFVKSVFMQNREISGQKKFVVKIKIIKKF